MSSRFMCIWFPFLKTDWVIINNPSLKDKALVLSQPDHGRLVVSEANPIAVQQGIHPGMVIADARAIFPSIEVYNDKTGLEKKLLRLLAHHCLRYTPIVSLDLPTGLILDVTGCAHLWQGEKKYIEHMHHQFIKKGFQVRVAIADTIGAAWAFARYGEQNLSVIHPGEQSKAILSLPASAMRLESEIVERLNKLGLKKVNDFIQMPSSVLRRRFGQSIINRIMQATGMVEEFIQPEYPPEPFVYRLPCIEPISTRAGIEIALKQLLQLACEELKKESKGLRHCIFHCFRIDHKIETIEITTTLASADPQHLFGLFEIKIDQIEPALGIELFMLEAKRIEEIIPAQQQLWGTDAGLLDEELAQLIDRLGGKFGKATINRFLPAEHYWPERSYVNTTDLSEKKKIEWPIHRPRPIHLLHQPEKIEVMAPIPDYPPMNFRHKGKLHKVISADGPERIEQEWWLSKGEHRDYYHVEDEEGIRYWIFREGHYKEAGTAKWFLHGYFS